jgi:2-haloacid dehalogenase
VQPPTLVFDVNETLSDLIALEPAFAAVGAPPALATTWFAATLRDGFALTAQHAAAPFAEVARACLVGLLSRQDGLDRTVEAAAELVLDRFRDLSVHADVPEGLRALAVTGCPLVTLSNGATAVADRLLATAGVRNLFDQLLSVEEAGVWKPHPDAYLYGASRAGRRPDELVLVAVHPWDIDGAARAGWRTAYLDRTGTPWPPVFRRPDHHVRSLAELAETLS